MQTSQTSLARRGIGVVVNPLAARNRDDKRAASRLARIVGDHGVVAESRDPEEVPRIASDFKRQGIDVLAISGGDGTSSLTLTSFRSEYAGAPLPSIAFLRGGTMNTVANALKVPRGRPDGLLTRLVERYIRGEARQLGAASTMDIDGRVGFLFGTGLLHAFLQEYYAGGRPHPTPWTAVKTLAKGAASVLVQGQMARRLGRRDQLALEIDGVAMEQTDYLGIAAGTVAEVGLGFRPFYLAESNPDAFHFLSIHGSISSFLVDLPRLHAAEGFRPRTARERIAREIRVLPTRHESFGYMIDGDLERHEGPLTVKAGPRVTVVA